MTAIGSRSSLLRSRLVVAGGCCVCGVRRGVVRFRWRHGEIKASGCFCCALRADTDGEPSACRDYHRAGAAARRGNSADWSNYGPFASSENLSENGDCETGRTRSAVFQSDRTDITSGVTIEAQRCPVALSCLNLGPMREHRCSAYLRTPPNRRRPIKTVSSYRPALCSGRSRSGAAGKCGGTGRHPAGRCHP